MNELEFEWDPIKNTKNQKKHGVSFKEASTVFSDDMARLIPDPDHSINEERFLLLGMSATYNLLTLSHCEISANKIRIISARKANKIEHKQYKEYRYA